MENLPDFILVLLIVLVTLIAILGFTLIGLLRRNARINQTTEATTIDQKADQTITHDAFRDLHQSISSNA